ncbi:MAG: hypothetical protein IJT36_08885 [Alphaproteobacteria bacterium]|nr:hypothetical protein [Alphaproteobacteria bacterium]
MKYLKIKNGKGYFLNSEEIEIEIDKIKRDDILHLLDSASDETINFEIDTMEYDKIKNEAHKIIYQSISSKMQDFLERRMQFIEESNSLYKDALEKYT